MTSTILGRQNHVGDRNRNAKVVDRRPKMGASETTANDTRTIWWRLQNKLRRAADCRAMIEISESAALILASERKQKGGVAAPPSTALGGAFHSSCRWGCYRLVGGEVGYCGGMVDAHSSARSRILQRPGLRGARHGNSVLPR